MIDLKDLRENPEKYRKGAQAKGIAVDVASLIDADDARIRAQQAFEKLKAEQNAASKEIGKLKGDEKTAAIARTAQLKEDVKSAEERFRAAEAAVRPMLLMVPQPPDDDVPAGRDESDNVVLYRWGDVPKFDFPAKTHIELAESLGLVDFAAGVKLSGSRSYFLKGLGSQLHSAVLRLAMDLIIGEKGFTALTVPVLVREDAMTGTGFFPAGREQTYHVVEDEVYLTGTAEVGLTAYHLNEVLDESDLPKRYAATSTCFRREAGTYGRDTAGLYRVHQFDKVEQVVICRADVDESKQWHQTMLGYSEELLQRLNLPYRVIQVCTGDLGPKNASMIDIETYMPGRATEKDPDSGYGETHSASRLYDFQARRMNLRYKDAEGKIRFCHTLNNTVAASPRILIPILENNQNPDGSVTVPEALRAYMGGVERIG